MTACPPPPEADKSGGKQSLILDAGYWLLDIGC